MLGSGSAEFTSPLFSDVWTFRVEDQVRASAVRHPRRHYSEVSLLDGTVWILQPEAWGVVQALEDDVPFARATRQGWSGRQWELGGVGFSYLLRNRSLVRRRWSVDLGNEPISRLSGRPFSYNRLRVETDIPLPLVVILLAWHVVCRSWEASAHPHLLIPARRPGAVVDPS